jgi:hypothetical protein
MRGELQTSEEAKCESDSVVEGPRYGIVDSMEGGEG